MLKTSTLRKKIIEQEKIESKMKIESVKTKVEGDETDDGKSQKVWTSVPNPKGIINLLEFRKQNNK